MPIKPKIQPKKNATIAAVLNFLVWGLGYVYAGKGYGWGWVLAFLGFAYHVWMVNTGFAYLMANAGLFAMHIIISVLVANHVYQKLK